MKWKATFERTQADVNRSDSFIQDAQACLRSPHGARGTKGTMPEQRRYPQQTLQDCDVQGASIPAWLYAAARLIFVTGATIGCLALKMTSRLL